MKKLFILLFFITASKGFGQTYTFYYSYTKQLSGCTDGWHGWKLQILTPTIPIENITKQENNSQYPENFYSRQYTLKANPTMFNFEIIAYDCTSSTICDAKIKKQTFTLPELIKAGATTVWDCKYYQRFAIDGFVANATIKNQDNNSPNEICAGTQLELAAFPTELVSGSTSGFPDEVHHWQYSLDNQLTWIDVPISYNNNKLLRSTIYELLGKDHEKYYNKDLYFRLGYSQNRAFSNSLKIKYSPCAPIITSITPSGAKCNGEPVNVIVTFDRGLYQNERLTEFQITKIDGQLTGNQIPTITSFDIANPSQFTYNNIVGLETGAKYTVKYLAFMGPTPKGLMTTPSEFLYTDPAKMKFEITNYTEPSCAGGSDATIEIKVLSGTSPYHFYKDGVELTGASQPSFANGKYYITGLKAQTHSIMVTDSKGCIEKI